MQTNVYSTSTNDLSSSVDLTISCTDLPKLDKLSKSDPMVIVYNASSGFTEIGRTELIKNEHNPKFTKTIASKYYFEEVQKLYFLVVDVDNPHTKIDFNSKGKDVIGHVECTLGEIMGSHGALKKEIINQDHPNRKNGFIHIRGVETSNGSNSFIKFRLSGTNLDKKDFLSKSDPYVIIHRGDATGSNWSVVHKTEVIKNTLNPTWKEFVLPVGKLCGGDVNLPLMFECFDWDSDSKSDLIGIFKTTLAEMRSKKQFELIEPKIQAKKGSKYKNSGILHINMEEYTIPTFLDFVTGGTEISLIVGIDYTASNKDPNDPSSLHYLNPTGAPNEYMAAIRVIGDIVIPYDKDHLVPTYGFGGYLNTIRNTSHCFSLTGNEENPFCAEIDGVLAAYRNSFQWVQLSGPTNFAPIINAVTQMAQQHKMGDKYFILLMLTDGIITDMNATIEALRRAADTPLSIIIVGVGDADFSNMNVLDDDDGKLGFKRDLVQFVPFRKYGGQSVAMLAKETLAEVPKQLVDYMVQHNLRPLAPPMQAPPMYTPSAPPPMYTP